MLISDFCHFAQNAVKWQISVNGLARNFALLMSQHLTATTMKILNLDLGLNKIFSFRNNIALIFVKSPLIHGGSMKIRSFLKSTLLLACLSQAVFATDNNDGICVGEGCNVDNRDRVNLGDIKLPVRGVFLPNGFDANDDTEAIVSVFAPTPCDTPQWRVERDGNNIKIDVTATRSISPDRVCIDMAVKHLITIPLGQLNEGTYTIKVNPDAPSTQSALLKISPPSNISIDNYLYANVEHVRINQNRTQVTLFGTNPSDCVALKEIKFTSNGLNTYAILPIMEKIKDDCPVVDVPFEYTVDLPHDFGTDMFLVHVRSLKSRSVNILSE